MICKDRDADLLLYQLGDLRPVPRLAVGLHLATCARCRARLGELRAVSAGMRSVLAPPIGVAPPIQAAPARLRMAIIMVTIMVIAVGAFAAVKVFCPEPGCSHSHIRKTEDAGCNPGLASDKCK